MKNFTIKFGIMALLIYVSGSRAIADTWCHGFLNADDGTKIQIDYQVDQYQPMRMPTYWTMKNVYVHVKNNQFVGSEKISVVFTTAVNGAKPSWSEVARDIIYDGSRYTASGNAFDWPFHSLIQTTGRDGGGPRYHFEVAIVADGQWLNDPVSKESNFKFFADRYSNFCANPY